MGYREEVAQARKALGEWGWAEGSQAQMEAAFAWAERITAAFEQLTLLMDAPEGSTHFQR